MKKITLLLLSILISALPVFADLVEEEPDFTDNTAALGTGDNYADTENENGEAVGTKEGEVTLLRTVEGFDVYSGLNKVEAIPTGSDGWVGQIVDETENVLFTPAGRPQLDCPAQDVANWYGPCKAVQQDS